MFDIGYAVLRSRRKEGSGTTYLALGGLLSRSVRRTVHWALVMPVSRTIHQSLSLISREIGRRMASLGSVTGNLGSSFMARGPLLLAPPGLSALHGAPAGAAFDRFSFGLEILRPYAELISYLLPDRDPEQVSAS